MSRSNPVLIFTTMLISLLVLAGCGDDDDERSEREATDPDVVVAESDEATGAPAPASDDYGLPLFGGAVFAGPPGLQVAAPGEFRVIIAPADDGETVVLVARVSQSASGQPVTTSAEMIDQLELVSGAEVIEGDEPIEAFGQTLAQFHVTGADDSFAFSASPLGFDSNAAWWPDPVSDLYVADLGDSVMAVVAMGNDDEGRARANALLRDLAPTMVLTTDTGEPDPLPEPESALAFDFGPPPTVEAAAPIADGPPILEDAFTPLEPGSYQLLNLGVPLVVDVPDGWAVQPNFPAIVVLGDVASQGPYDDELRLQVAMRVLAPAGAGEVPIGEGTPLEDIAVLLADPPANLTISNVDLDAEVGGLAAIRFDATIADPVGCDATNPCSYGLFGPFANDPAMIIGDYTHRLWIITGVPNGPLTLAAAATDAEAEEWFARVDEVVASIDIVTDP